LKARIMANHLLHAAYHRNELFESCQGQNLHIG
jgi:hypothetical protein